MKRIAIITSWYPSGAGYVSKAYRRIFEREFDVYIYVRGGKTMKNDENWDDNKVFWPRNINKDINLKEFNKFIKKNHIDLLFFNEQRYWEPLLFAKKLGLKIGSYIDYYTEETIPLFDLYDFLICNTLRHYSVFKNHKQCFYIPWGTEIYSLKKFVRSPELPIIFIISLGWDGLHPGDRKGAKYSIQAFKNVIGDCKLLIYSQVKFEDCLFEWKKIILNDFRIEFIYGTFDPFPYEKGHVYLYPSRLDGIGLSLPEAISSGLPAITTNNPPMNEFVINNFNGTLIDVDEFVSRYDGYYWPQSNINLLKLSEAIQNYVNHPELIKTQSKNSLTYAEKYLNWENNSKNLNSIIEHILNQKNKYFNTNTYSDLLLRVDRRLNPSFLFRISSLVDELTFHLFKIKLPRFNKLKSLK